MIFLLILAVLTIAEILIKKPFIASTVGLIAATVLNGGEIPRRLSGTHRIFVLRNFPLPLELTALTLGEIILVHERDQLNIILEIHEVTHKQQYKKFGSIPFLAIYLLSWLWFMVKFRGDWKKSYKHIPFEREARKVEERNK